MAVKLFPERQRCRACSKGFGKAVLFGLYCSPRCATIAQPVTDPASAPRECVTQREGQWFFKRRYRAEVEIPQPIRDDPSANSYWCNHCGHLHIGHMRIRLDTEQFRMLQGVDDLGDLLVKLRGKATRKQVAEVAGIRPIRLKELEEPGATDRIDLAALFAVLAVYRVRPGVALRS